MKKKMELILIPFPGAGHLFASIQLAKLLISRDHRLSVTVILIPLSLEPKSAAELESPNIRFITLPDNIHPEDAKNGGFIKTLDAQKLNVKEAVANLAHSADDSPTLAGFVLDMFCANMTDVANEFQVPSYIFFTSSAGYLAFTFHLQQLYDTHNRDSDKFLHSDSEITIPSFEKPIPAKAIPSVYSIQPFADWLHENTRRFRETKGILVNSFSELESKVFKWFSEDTKEFPPVYAVGPILNLKNSEKSSDIVKWLDEQPPLSVVFLCFGSRGSVSEKQAKEIALALERSGHRFLWSLRKPSPTEKHKSPSEYEDLKEVLPDGFLDRTAGIGKVIGWAPQVEILAHAATGGFVSHCGWNSTMESVWCGVPIGAWPMYAEQHFNAFEMVEELGLAVEIGEDAPKMDFRYSDTGVTVSAEKIETGIRKLMEKSEELRELVKTKSEEARRSVMEGGSSFSSLNRFVEHVVANCP